MKEQDEALRVRHLNQTKTAVNLAFDVKKNSLLKLLEDFDKRYLRLKIVQHTKRNMPQIAAFGQGGGLGFDAD
jgi:hypothetical protein